MKSLFLSLVCAICSCQLAVAVGVNIAPVVIESDGNTANSCFSEEKFERTIESLRDDVISRLSIPPQCGDTGEGIWYQLVSINMSSADSQCPYGWVEENEGGVRACGRGTVDGSCQSAFFNNDDHQIQYTRVCGRAIGYQYKSTDAFSQTSSNLTIDEIYVDGLSITHGSPRQHLWTFTAGWSEGLGIPSSTCPCSSNPGVSSPSFLNNNWYCESGNPTSQVPAIVYSSDPLWDGVNCEGTCCSNGKSPPWFSVELPAPTSDRIEARICADENHGNENVFIQVFEIFVQ